MSRNPKARLDNLPTAIFNKLDEVIEIIEERKVGVILIAGDVFDYPYQSYSTLLRTHFKFQAIKKRLKEPKLILAVFGQHDLYFQRLDEAINKTALGAIARLGSVKILHNESPLKIKD